MSKSQTINAAMVAAWYNRHFIAQEEALTAEVSITIGQEVLTIPAVKIRCGTSIDDMVRGFHAYLKENGPLSDDPLKERKADLGDVANFDQITYRDNDYMVEHWVKEGKSKYIVSRKDDGRVINAKSPNAKKIVALFKEKYPPKSGD